MKSSTLTGPFGWRILLLMMLMSCTHHESDEVTTRTLGPLPIGATVDIDLLPIRQELWGYILSGNDLFRLECNDSVACKVFEFPFQVDFIDQHKSAIDPYALRDISLNYYPNTESHPFLTVWSGTDLYHFDPDSATLIPFNPSGRLNEFLSHPLVSVILEDYDNGCTAITHAEEEYVVQSIPNPILSIAGMRSAPQHLPIFIDRGNQAFTRVLPHEIAKLLRRVNTNSTRIPAIVEFGITDVDRGKFVSAVNEWTDRSAHITSDDPLVSDYSELQNLGMDEESAPHVLGPVPTFDTIGTSVLQNALQERRERWTSTSTRTVRVRLINDRDSAITIYSSTPVFSSPYLLPLSIMINGVAFESYDLDLARAVMLMDPVYSSRPEMERKENARLLDCIAAYLYRQEERERLYRQAQSLRAE